MKIRGFLPGDIINCTSVVPRQSANTLPGQISCITQRAEKGWVTIVHQHLSTYSHSFYWEICIIDLVNSVIIKLNSKFSRLPERCHIVFHSKVWLIIGECDLAKDIDLLNSHVMWGQSEVWTKSWVFCRRCEKSDSTVLTLFESSFHHWDAKTFFASSLLVNFKGLPMIFCWYSRLWLDTTFC